MELAIVEKDDALVTREEVDRNSRLNRGNTAPDAICTRGVVVVVVVVVVVWGGARKGKAERSGKGKKSVTS